METNFILEWVPKGGKAVAGGDEGERWCHRPFQGGNEERKTRRTEFTEDTE